jgi:hypothetical protein
VFKTATCFEAECIYKQNYLLKLTVSQLVKKFSAFIGLTPWSRDLLEKLTGLQLVKKFIQVFL